MKEIKALSSIDESDYSISEVKQEEAHNRIRCYDVILSDEEARKYDEIAKIHYKETLEYERQKRKQS